MGNALQERLDAVDQEIDDLRSLLSIMRRIERDEQLRERLRSIELGFPLQDLAAGRLTGDALRRARETLEGIVTPPRAV